MTRNRKANIVAASLVALLASSVLTILPATAPVAQAQEDNGGRPKINVPRASGRKIFSEYCVLCHKYDGRGGPSEGGYGADLRKTALTREQVIVIITYGRQARGMPPFKDLLESEKIEILADFILNDLRLPELKNN